MSAAPRLSADERESLAEELRGLRALADRIAARYGVDVDARPMRPAKRPEVSERDRAEARRIARRMGLVVRERSK